jgi:dTDP-4-dehydrorhamnose reductase
MIELAAPHAQQARIKNRQEVGLQRAQQSTQRRIATAFGLTLPDWQHGVRRMLAETSP